MEIQNQPSKTELQTKKRITISQTISFVIEFGFIILLPLLAFGYLGKWLTGKYDNRLYLIGGLILALLTSSVWCYRRIYKIYKEFIS